MRISTLKCLKIIHFSNYVTQKWKIECGFFSKDYGIGIGKTAKMIEKLSAAATMFGGRQAIFATLVLQSHERTIICLNDQSIGLFIATK